MPSPLAHLAAGYVLCRTCDTAHPIRSSSCGNRRALLIVAGLSLLPDLDFIGGILFGKVGRQHNNISHSLAFGILTGLVAGTSASITKVASFKRWFLVASIYYTLHLFMDFWSSRRGIMLLWPLSSRRVVAPIKLFYGVRWKEPPFSGHHFRMIFTESLFALLLISLTRLFLDRQGQ